MQHVDDACTRMRTQAINVQFISWAPWDPFVMTTNAHMNQDKAFEPVKALV